MLLPAIEPVEGACTLRTTPTRLHRAAAALLALVLAAGSLAGCASHAGNIDLAVDPSDPCGPQRAALSESRTFFSDQIAVGAAKGALAGGLVGALAGGAAGGGRGALIGLVAGAAAGGIAGGTAAYYNTMSERYHDQATLARGINQDLARESQEMDHVNASFARLRECRFGVAQQVKYQVRSGQIPREAAISTLGYQRQMFDQEIQVARAYGVSMQKRDDEFRTAAVNLQKQDPNYTPPPPPPPNRVARHRPPPPLTPTQQVVTNATESIPEKRTAYVASVDDAARRSQVAFNVDQPGTGGAS
jgi:uncharacterized protein YcfJ